MNEPVAWMSPDGKVSDTEGKLFYIPLYTHPTKELTSDELMQIFYEMTALSKLHCEVLTKAILRKAQEK